MSSILTFSGRGRDEILWTV